MKLRNKPLPIAMFLLALIILASILWQIVDWNKEYSLFIIFCSAVSLLFTLALAFSKDCHLYNPLLYIFLVVFVGVTVRGYYMVYDSSNVDVRRLFLGINDIGYFTLPAFIILCSFILFFIGYKITNTPLHLRKMTLFSMHAQWNAKRVQRIVVLFMFISILGIYLFIKSLGIESLMDNISGKRYLTLDDSMYRASLGYYRLMASFIEPAFYILLLYFILGLRKLWSFSGFMLILLGLINIAFSFFNSDRTSLMFFILNIFIILNLTKKLSLRFFASFILLAGLLFSVVTTLRSSESNDIQVDQAGLLDPVILNRNLLDISVTANIVNSVPEKMKFQYGKTFLSLLVAPVPRNLWPEKPNITPGYDISHQIYGFSEANTSGIPPNIIGELYLNFGLAGIFVGLFILGIFVKKIYLYFNFHRSFNRNKVILYVAAIMNITVLLFGASFNQAVLALLQAYIPIYIALKYVTYKKNSAFKYVEA